MLLCMELLFMFRLHQNPGPINPAHKNSSKASWTANAIEQLVGARNTGIFSAVEPAFKPFVPRVGHRSVTPFNRRPHLSLGMSDKLELAPKLVFNAGRFFLRPKHILQYIFESLRKKFAGYK